MNVQEMIANHTSSIISGNISSPDIVCRNCYQKPDYFKLHESRKREFRIVVKDIVEVTMSFLLRWRCLLCDTTFTEYPPFALPHKRFVLTDIKRFGQKYLGNDDVSYRNAAMNDGANIGYPDENGLCNNFLSHTSIWRFMTYLANIYESNRQCCVYKNTIPPISSLKYRSNHRRSLLYKALKKIAFFNQQAGSAIFPNFETGLT